MTLRIVAKSACWLRHVFPSVSVHLCALWVQLSLDSFSEIWYWKSMSRKSNFFKNRIKLQANYMKTQVCFIVASNINSPWKHCCAVLNTFILLTVTCSPTIHRERIVAFLLQVCLANSLHCCLLIRTLPISCTFYKRAAVNTNMKCRRSKMWERFVWPSSYYF